MAAWRLYSGTGRRGFYDILRPTRTNAPGDTQMDGLPLVVDLDGTLTYGDTGLRSLFAFVRRNAAFSPFRALDALFF